MINALVLTIIIVVIIYIVLFRTAKKRKSKSSSIDTIQEYRDNYIDKKCLNHISKSDYITKYNSQLDYREK